MFRSDSVGYDSDIYTVKQFTYKNETKYFIYSKNNVDKLPMTTTSVSRRLPCLNTTKVTGQPDEEFFYPLENDRKKENCDYDRDYRFSKINHDKKVYEYDIQKDSGVLEILTGLPLNEDEASDLSTYYKTYDLYIRPTIPWKLSCERTKEKGREYVLNLIRASKQTIDIKTHIIVVAAFLMFVSILGSCMLPCVTDIKTNVPFFVILGFTFVCQVCSIIAIEMFAHKDKKLIDTKIDTYKNLSSIDTCLDSDTKFDTGESYFEDTEELYGSIISMSIISVSGIGLMILFVALSLAISACCR